MNFEGFKTHTALTQAKVGHIPKKYVDIVSWAARIDILIAGVNSGDAPQIGINDSRVICSTSELVLLSLFIIIIYQVYISGLISISNNAPPKPALILLNRGAP